MTLDEAIKQVEERADLCEYEASRYDMSDSYENYVACQESKCAKEQRQLAEWLKELKQLKEQIRWIPVSERSPEVGEYVLASVHDDYADYNIIINKYEEQAFWSNGIITAWKPLPAPYKESDSE